MFQLLAVIGGADVDAGDQVGPVEQAVVGADIEKLNWENVARVADLFFGKQQRRGLAVLNPPAQELSRAFQLRKLDLFEHTEDVQVGVLLVIIAGGRRSVEDDREQVVTIGSSQLFDQFAQQLFH